MSTRSIMQNWCRLALLVLLWGGSNVWAATITGVVKNEAGSGLSNVDLDFIDLCSGDNIFLTGDKTAADGSYSVVVPNGTYDIHYTPPTGSTVAAGERQDYIVSANANLGTTTLHPGRLVSGKVQNSAGTGIANVDLKFVSRATSERVYLTKDLTSATGQYSVRVPPGTWDIDFRPPSTSNFVDAERLGLVVGASDISGLVDTVVPGINVTGTIQDTHNIKLKNVDVDLFDSCTGERVATAHDNTDVNGNFSVYVPAGTYSINYDPPRCKALASERFPGQVITAATNMGTTKLDDAFAVSGHVVDHNGAPLFDAKVKFYDEKKAFTRRATARDRTDATGAYSILVPKSDYTINVEPPVTTDDLVAVQSAIRVNGPIDLGTTALAAGIPVTGLVVGPTNQPVKNVNINAVDAVTRVALHLAHDASAADGTFRVVMPPGVFDIQYDPPACSNDAPMAQRSMTIAGPLTALPTMHLVTGAHARGIVRDSVGVVQPLVDLDFYPVGSTTKSYTPNDTTAADGSYDTTVIPATYDIRYIPPTGSRLRPALRPNTPLLVNTTLSDTVLASGWLVSGLVNEASTLLPVAGTVVEFYPPGGPVPAWTPHQITDIAGLYNTAVDAGTWDLLYTPPATSILAPRWRRGVVVVADTPLPDTSLLPLTTPTVSTITPVSGSTAGGTAVTVSGSGFQPDAIVKLGGVTARSINVISSTQITATTAAHPPRTVDVTVVNPGNRVGNRVNGFTYTEPAVPVRLTVTKSGGAVVLSWLSTGQPTYTVFRSVDPKAFADDSILGTTATLSYTDSTSGSAPGVRYYQVD